GEVGVELYRQPAADWMGGPIVVKDDSGAHAGGQEVCQLHVEAVGRYGPFPRSLQIGEKPGLVDRARGDRQQPLPVDSQPQAGEEARVLEVVTLGVASDRPTEVSNETRFAAVGEEVV